MVQTADIKAALRAVYTQPEYALAFEVSDATGGRAARRADAVAMCMWPSRGLAVLGFEIKVSRSDWLRELRKPAKAENIWRYCDEWTLVTGPEVAKAEEIPEGWGWTVYDGKFFQAMSRPARRTSDAPSKDFVAAMLRAAGKPDGDELRAMVQRERQKIEADFTARVEAEVTRRVESRTREIEKHADKYQALDAMLPGKGFIGDDEFAAAVRLVLEIGAVSVYGGVRRLQGELDRHLRKIDEACSAMGIPSAEELDAAHKLALDNRRLARAG